MRFDRKLFVDNIYYGIDQWISRFARNHRGRTSVRGLTFDKSFYSTYKNQILPYWKKYGIRPKIFWYKWYYHLTGELDPRYIPDDIHHHYIIPYFDDRAFVKTLTDKNLASLLFPGVNRPQTLFKYSARCYCEDDFTPISRDEAFRRLSQEGHYIIKPTRRTGEGTGISFFRAPANDDAVNTVLDKCETMDCIVQHVMVQHPALAAFNLTSVNTIRVVTMVLHGEAHILSAILRIGQAGSQVDNVSKGGYQAVIQPDGTLAKYAYTHEGGQHKHVTQTLSGTVFEGAVIPNWKEVQRTAKDLALKLPHLKLIGWDLSLDEQGRVTLIEFNCHFGQNQENCGPTFGDMTETVLDEVFKDRKGIK